MVPPTRRPRTGIHARRKDTQDVWLWYIAYFFGGAFLTNAIPHLVSGLMGRAFQSPFAKPPGKGLSSSTVNVLWGFFNLVIAYVLIARVGIFSVGAWDCVLAAGAGALLMGVMLARTFGQLHGGNTPGETR
jgi:hypothetical protein